MYKYQRWFILETKSAASFFFWKSHTNPKKERPQDRHQRGPSQSVRDMISRHYNLCPNKNTTSAKKNSRIPGHTPSRYAVTCSPSAARGCIRGPPAPRATSSSIFAGSHDRLSCCFVSLRSQGVVFITLYSIGSISFNNGWVKVELKLM